VHYAIPALHVHRHLHGSPIGLTAVFLAAALSWVGITGPGEAALIAAGIAASRGRSDIASIILVAWAGAALGGVAGWLVGRYGGRRVLLAGRWMRRRRERMLEHGNRFFERFGWVAVYFAPSWAAGVNAMSAARFLPANAVCSLVWALLIGLGSYAIGPSIRDIASDIGLYGVIATVVIALGLGLSTRFGVRRRRARRDHPPVR
jgi:membrane protein DedA with SNARE-associated domain